MRNITITVRAFNKTIHHITSDTIEVQGMGAIRYNLPDGPRVQQTFGAYPGQVVQDVLDWANKNLEHALPVIIPSFPSLSLDVLL